MSLTLRVATVSPWTFAVAAQQTVNHGKRIGNVQAAPFFGNGQVDIEDLDRHDQ